MKASTVLSFLFTAVCVFQIGAYYGARPYRGLALAGSTKEELLRISAEQGRVSVVISLVALGLILVNAGLVFTENSRTKKNA